ncbi:MAG: hypothetical protein JWR38_3314 [Mucilaginibacter sp.]|nr:hypothetical protein [Mucilaginibacter sp.]
MASKHARFLSPIGCYLLVISKATGADFRPDEKGIFGANRLGLYVDNMGAGKWKKQNYGLVFLLAICFCATGYRKMVDKIRIAPTQKPVVILFISPKKINDISIP